MRVERLGEYRYIIRRQGNMRTDAYVFASERLLNKMKEDSTLEQIVNVASLPGVLKYPSVMPDGHEGYGFPVGGVAAFENIISPGGVGFDINCGVRLLDTGLSKDEIMPKIRELSDRLFKSIPAGLGEGGIRLRDSEIDQVLELGVVWAKERGFAYTRDPEFIEENGKIDGADPTKISKTAKARGRNQLGSLGSGNHFLEVQYVDRIFDEELAKFFGLYRGKIMVMIHTGSRGLGHQIASDYIAEIIRNNRELPERDLAYTRIDTDTGQNYLGAMRGAVNYAFANRQILTHIVREVLYETFRSENVKIVYDVAHNIAKIERHKVDGEMRDVIVHRKGATRAFPAGQQDIPEIYRSVGQPVIIPGSMGTSSYLLVGSRGSMELSFGSTCHGAGRVMSRNKARQTYRAESVLKDLAKEGIIIRARTDSGVVEEVPQAYKDVDEVVRVVFENDLSRPVAVMRPLVVIKG
ncbi:MAG: RtcB family protein [Candidatus Micrarchaeota archaeon]|nr:RtcB family protein [Candidatus Micrarchaeota archaeon]MCX8154632.1 RtcB family protein [Candidatus Micrarchaeota archaeon]